MNTLPLASVQNKKLINNLNKNIMSYVRIWVHLVFSTKNRIHFLSKKVREMVRQHIIDNCFKKEILLKEINGYEEHLHCLISLGKEQSISKVSQLIKGESSFWINKNNLCKEKFMWQDDYFAISVSDSQISSVVKYIKNQEKHHTKTTFPEEVEKFINKYDFQLIKDSI
jgi:putative transposase